MHPDHHLNSELKLNDGDVLVVEHSVLIPLARSLPERSFNCLYPNSLTRISDGLTFLLALGLRWCLTYVCMVAGPRCRDLGRSGLSHSSAVVHAQG